MRNLPWAQRLSEDVVVALDKVISREEFMPGHPVPGRRRRQGGGDDMALQSNASKHAIMMTFTSFHSSAASPFTLQIPERRTPARVTISFENE